MQFIPEEERTDLLAAYQKRLMGSDVRVRTQAAQTWATFKIPAQRWWPKDVTLGQQLSVWLFRSTLFSQ